MQKNGLGTSSLTVSKVCLGSMSFGEQNSEAAAHSQLDYAIERQQSAVRRIRSGGHAIDVETRFLLAGFPVG